MSTPGYYALRAPAPAAPIHSLTTVVQELSSPISKQSAMRAKIEAEIAAAEACIMSASESPKSSQGDSTPKSSQGGSRKLLTKISSSIMGESSKKRVDGTLLISCRLLHWNLTPFSLFPREFSEMASRRSTSLKRSTSVKGRTKEDWERVASDTV